VNEEEAELLQNIAWETIQEYQALQQRVLIHPASALHLVRHYLVKKEIKDGISNC
jgi:hypothetical protein